MQVNGKVDWILHAIIIHHIHMNSYDAEAESLKFEYRMHMAVYMWIIQEQVKSVVELS